MESCGRACTKRKPCQRRRQCRRRCGASLNGPAHRVRRPGGPLLSAPRARGNSVAVHVFAGVVLGSGRCGSGAPLNVLALRLFGVAVGAHRRHIGRRVGAPVDQRHRVVDLKRRRQQVVAPRASPLLPRRDHKPHGAGDCPATGSHCFASDHEGVYETSAANGQLPCLQQMPTRALSSLC